MCEIFPSTNLYDVFLASIGISDGMKGAVGKFHLNSQKHKAKLVNMNQYLQQGNSEWFLS